MNLDDLARQLAPLIRQMLLTMPAVWGDPERVHTEDNVALTNTLFNTSSGEIFIGRGSFFGHNVSLITGSHPVKEFSAARKSFPSSGRDITIGKNVWIATNAVVLGPCLIGDNAVIAAGAVVLPGEYAGGCIYGGIPAKLLRNLEDNSDPARQTF